MAGYGKARFLPSEDPHKMPARRTVPRRHPSLEYAGLLPRRPMAQIRSHRFRPLVRHRRGTVARPVINAKGGYHAYEKQLYHVVARAHSCDCGLGTTQNGAAAAAATGQGLGEAAQGLEFR